MKSKFLVLQHVDWEGPGRLLLDMADRLSIELHIVPIWKESAPDSAGFDALILLGGSPNVDQEELYPFLKEEKRFLQAWLALDKPCLAFCLGHQLLADAFQAKVGPNFMTSVGFIEGHLTHDGRKHPLFKGIQTPFPLFKWHGQAIHTPVPHNFILLATSSECVVEAFTIKGRPHIIGLQCDNHAAHPDDVHRWMENDHDWLSRLPPELVSGSALLGQAKKSMKTNRAMFTQLFKNFISLVNK